MRLLALALLIGCGGVAVDPLAGVWLADLELRIPGQATEPAPLTCQDGSSPVTSTVRFVGVVGSWAPCGKPWELSVSDTDMKAMVGDSVQIRVTALVRAPGFIGGPIAGWDPTFDGVWLVLRREGGRQGKTPGNYQQGDN